MLLSDRILTPGQVGSGTVYHNTSAGNVDGTLPVTPNEGTQIRVVNIGTGDNKVINLPDSIELGNGKSIIFVYHDTVWYYEDVIIEESSGPAIVNNGSATYYLIKWAGGKFTYSAEGTNTNNPCNHTMPVADIGAYRSFAGNASMTGSSSRIIGFNSASSGPLVGFYRVNASNSLSAGPYIFMFEGRWK